MCCLTALTVDANAVSGQLIEVTGVAAICEHIYCLCLFKLSERNNGFLCVRVFGGGLYHKLCKLKVV